VLYRLGALNKRPFSVPVLPLKVENHFLQQ